VRARPQSNSQELAIYRPFDEVGEDRNQDNTTALDGQSQYALKLVRFHPGHLQPVWAQQGRQKLAKPERPWSFALNLL
jgi:hypothetical protein